MIAMVRRMVPISLAAAVTASAGCALAPPARSDGPAVSREGVRVDVTRQRCDQVQEPDDYGWDLVEATLEVQVANATTSPLTIRRDAFRLRGPDGTALRTQTWGAADPITLGAGESRRFELRFQGRGGLECAAEMLLDVDSGLALPSGALKVGAIRFVPARA